MFQARDLSLFTESPNARRSFKRLRQLDTAVNVCLVLLAILCVWNTISLVRLQTIASQDLADISGIVEDPSTRLIWAVSAIALLLIGYREFRFGERTAGVMYPLTGILFALLVPAMMTEIEPSKEQQLLRVIRTECPAKNVVDGRVRYPSLCDPVAVAADDIRLANSDPFTTEFEIIPEQSRSHNTGVWTVEGRGTYTVYFLYQQDSVAACERAVIFNHYQRWEGTDKNLCLEWDNAVWLVMPHTTSANSVSSLHIVTVPQTESAQP